MPKIPLLNPLSIKYVPFLLPRQNPSLKVFSYSSPSFSPFPPFPLCTFLTGCENRRPASSTGPFYFNGPSTTVADSPFPRDPPPNRTLPSTCDPTRRSRGRNGQRFSLLSLHILLRPALSCVAPRRRRRSTTLEPTHAHPEEIRSCPLRRSSRTSPRSLAHKLSSAPSPVTRC